MTFVQRLKMAKITIDSYKLAEVKRRGKFIIYSCPVAFSAAIRENLEKYEYTEHSLNENHHL